MNEDFAAAMRRATLSVRARDPLEATAIIQSALAGPGQPGAGNSTPKRADRIAPPKLALPSPSAGPTRPARASRAAHATDVQPGRPKRARMPLGETLRRLRTGRLAMGLSALPDAPSMPGGKMPDVAEGARYLSRSFACPAGTRAYRLYVPACQPAALRGLVVMLHGCKQSPDDFALGTRMNEVAERYRLLVAYPAQGGGDNASACWNWFDPNHQSRGTGEPAILAGLTRNLAEEFAIAPGKVMVAGLSAGGAMAAVMAETYPELYGAVGIHSGLAYGSASDVASAFAAMSGQGAVGSGNAIPPAGTAHPRTIVFHGTADRTVVPANAERIAHAHRDRSPGESRSESGGTRDGRRYSRTRVEDAEGLASLELWLIEETGHAWSGGHPRGSFTDPGGPDASSEMVRFLLDAL